MGGAGKTQVALEYCRHRKKSNDFQGIFWLDASSLKRVGDDIMNIAKWLEPACELENTEAAMDLVKSILSGWTKPWLMVFDNLDNPSNFKDIYWLFPISAFGSILITSRNHGLQELAPHYLLQEMDEHDGLCLLFRRQNSVEDVVLGKQILEILGWLPLAIDQAGAYIAQRKLPLQDFITQFHHRKNVLLRDIPQIWPYQLSVGTTWEMSLSLLLSSSGQPSKDLEDILTLFGFFHPQAISEKIFSVSIEESELATSPMSIFNDNDTWNYIKFEKIITDMHKLSLLQFHRDNSSTIMISIHPLVSEWLRM
ncbi:hypothetical protein M422DRAFT_256222 [Sphaerobolus stellatus SS14]|uniref:NB-ARC domain-containing protein n=1 Tax=Sphaerobolus stellatus (strain SS14) TaxID=990650 RepID=A0A0C9V164_SPHS4|nr:hypothetical protein M422DRAFT_256222 [Sphaerobolus stellatus SS14]